MSQSKFSTVLVKVVLFGCIGFGSAVHAEPDWMRLGKPGEPEVTEEPVAPVVQPPPKVKIEAPVEAPVTTLPVEPASVNDTDALKQVAPASIANAKDLAARLGNLSGLDAFCGTVPQLAKKIQTRLQSLYNYSIQKFGSQPAGQLVQIYSAEQIKSGKLLRLNISKENGSSCAKFYKNFDKDILAP